VLAESISLFSFGAASVGLSGAGAQAKIDEEWSMGKLDGKVALVTGAASGIGRACVTRFLDEGARVAGVDLASPSDPWKDEVLFTELDVRDETAVTDAVNTAVAEFGRLDAVVTAAGVAGGGPAHMVDRDEWQRVLDVNLTGTFLTCKHAIARMLEQDPIDGERGSIVTIASVEGLEGTAGGSSYNASKGAVVIFTKNLSIDYGRSGIRANAICPGFIETPLAIEVANLEPDPEAALNAKRLMHPIARAGGLDEVGELAVYLASDLSAFMTGQAIALDGGYTVR
jgi:NAD(P)-dependent dehydrogenase (short-subunit alcohol dehydrogenase family)